MSSKGKQTDVVDIQPANTTPGVVKVQLTDIHTAAKPVSEEPTAYRVARGGKFSQHGQICTIPEGHIVRLGAYGKDAVMRMRSSGILLEPIDV